MYFMSQYVLLSLSIAMTCIVANLAKRMATAERPPHFLKKVGSYSNRLGPIVDLL